MKSFWKWCAAGAVFTIAAAGCGSSNTGAENAGSPGGAPPAAGGLKGEITGDGSSTVYPITEAVAEEFGKLHPDVKVTVGISGTGGGFKKFVVGDTILQDASRPIEAKEAKAAAEKSIEYIELPVAYDGLSIVVNPKNTWAKSLTKAELKKIWEPGSKINNWSQVRAGFPNQPLKLYGPGTDSGTFDYFTKEIVGKEKSSRADYTASEDDNTLVQGVSKDLGSLGYFGFAYYEENKTKLSLVAVDSGAGPVLPAPDTILSGKYKPLSRPLFIYVERKAADRPEVQEFVKFYLTKGKDLVRTVGYVALPDPVYTAAADRFEKRVTGSVFADPAAKGKPLESLYTSGAASAGANAAAPAPKAP